MTIHLQHLSKADTARCGAKLKNDPLSLDLTLTDDPAQTTCKRCRMLYDNASRQRR